MSILLFLSFLISLFPFQMAEISATGTVTNVQTKFAYIASDKGSVFCPLAASVDSFELCNDMREKYSIGDIVHFKATRQSSKNGCDLRAVHMSLSSKSSFYKGLESGDSTRDGIVAEITLVQETLAYGVNDEVGGIFIAGSVFSGDNIKRLNGFIKPGDLLNLSITRQAEKNGCKWRAVTAEIIVFPEITRGSYVVFEIMDSSKGNCATRWSLLETGLIGESPSQGPSFSPYVDSRDISTQTATHIEKMVIKCIPKSAKQELYNKIPVLEKLMDEVDLL